jgi:hypothetical protein
LLLAGDLGAPLPPSGVRFDDHDLEVIVGSSGWYP